MAQLRFSLAGPLLRCWAPSSLLSLSAPSLGSDQLTMRQAAPHTRAVRRRWAACAVSRPHTEHQTSEAPPQASAASRRAVVAGLVAAPLAAALPSRADTEAPEQPQELTVGPGGQFATVAAAVAAARPNAIVRVLPGRYAERLELQQAVTIIGDANNPAAVQLVWETTEPYQPVFFIAADGVVLRGLTIRHHSPSIANNYAVQMQDCSAVVDSCDISSSTGSGIGSEGGSPQLYRCNVHNCERNGVAVFGGLDGARASAVLENCELAWNKGHGLLIRDGATPSVSDSEIYRNGGYGMMLQDCGGSYSRNTVVENGAGAVGYQLVFEDFDVNDLVVENKLDRYPVKLSPLRR